MKTKGNSSNGGCAPLCAQVTGVRPQHEAQIAGMDGGVLTFRLSDRRMAEVSFGAARGGGRSVVVLHEAGAKCRTYGPGSGMTLVEMCAERLGDAYGAVSAGLVGIC